MKLNKRYLRNIKANLPFYLSASILTAVGLVLFFLFYIAGTGISAYGKDFFVTYKVEDASFTTYAPIPAERIAELEEKYDLTLEKERFVNQKEAGYTARVFVSNQKIDLYQIISGRDIENKNELLISAGYAEENKIDVGKAKIIIKGKEYTVVGSFLRPDYLYMLENLTDDYKNVKNFFLAYIGEEDFIEAFGEGSINYKVVYHDTEKILDFRKEVNANYYVSGYLSQENNTRITFVDEQAQVFIVCSWVMLVLLPFVTVALISIMIGRKIKGEQKVIGTLSAMGYTKNRLTLHYSIFALIPGIIGGALTTVLAFVLAGPFGKIGLADYEPLQPAFTLPVWVALTAILIPTVIYWLCAVVKVRRMLQRDTVDLLNNKVGNEGKNRRILAQKKTKVGIKMAVRSLVSNPGRSLVVFLGIFLGAMIIAFSLSMIDSIKEVGKSAHRDFGAFKYDYVLNTLQDGSPDYGEAVLVLPYETEGGTRFSVMGVDEDNTLWNLTTTSGKKADTKTGWYMSKLCAAIFGVKEGDTFTFRNTATLEEKSVRIDGIINNGYQMFIVSSRENVGGITELSSSKYNSILSDKALDFDDSVLSEVISDNTYETQMENLLSSMGGIIYSLAIIGAIICAVSLYAIVNMMVTENANNISMLKVLGMKNGKINNMVISANHLLLIPGIITGIAVAYAGMVWYCAAFIKIERIMIPATLHWYSILITAAVVILCYFVSLLLVRGKVNRTDMVECLKDNRE